MAAQQPPNVQFALNPSEAFGEGLINYSTREGMSLYRSITRCLYSDTANLFNAKPEGLQGFLNQMDMRIQECGWTLCFNIPFNLDDLEDAGVPICTNHGRFNLPHLREFATDYVGAQNRSSQNNAQAVAAILSSLTEDALAKIAPYEGQYTIGRQKSALLLLKVLIRESHIDTNARCRIARENLSSLDGQIKVQGYDIIKLNGYVQLQLQTLRSRGEQTLDLLPNLFKGYMAAKDDAFLDFVRRKKAEYDEGDKDTDPELFMSAAAAKYKTLVTEKLWNAPNKDQVKLLALEAEIKSLTAGRKVRFRAEGKCSPTSRGAGKRKEIPAWMTVKPSDEDIKGEVVKMKGGKSFYWCSNHKRYVRHKPSECTGVYERNVKHKSDDEKPKDGNIKEEKALKLATALQAELDNSDGGDESD